MPAWGCGVWGLEPVWRPEQQDAAPTPPLPVTSLCTEPRPGAQLLPGPSHSLGPGGGWQAPGHDGKAISWHWSLSAGNDPIFTRRQLAVSPHARSYSRSSHSGMKQQIM